MGRGVSKLLLSATPGGVREDQNPAAVDEGYLLSSNNWIARSGRGRPRDGYDRLGTAAVSSADRIIGFGFRGSVAIEKNLVLHTLTKAFSWDGGTYTDRTGTWTTTTADRPVRFATLSWGGTLFLLRVNEDNAMDKWSGTGNFADPTQTAPKGRDITSTNSRVVIARADGNVYRYQFSNFRDGDKWTASDFIDLDATPDEAMACRAFGPLTLAAYKEDSIWLGVAQIATEPFQFQYISAVPGPVSPSALITYRGWQYWLGKDGVVYRFNGSSIEAFGTDLRSYITTNWDWGLRVRSHCWILAQAEPELYFALPRISSQKLDLGFSINLVTKTMHPHTYTHEVSASSEWIAQPTVAWDDLTGTWNTLSNTYASWDAMASGSEPTAVLGGIDGVAYQFGINDSDFGTAIPWDFTHPWRTPAGLGKRTYLDGIASYWKKAATSLVVTVGVTVTNSLGDADTESTKTFNLTTDSNHLVTFPDTVGQWVKVKHSGSGYANDVEHRGAAILGFPRGMT